MYTLETRAIRHDKTRTTFSLEMTSLIKEISSNIIDVIVQRKNYALYPRVVESKEQTDLYFYVAYVFLLR